MSESIYQIKDMSKAYNGREVLHIDDLVIRKGEIFAIVGPSGSGKSTLLRLLNFLEMPTSGSIRFGDYTINGTGSAPLKIRRKVTTVFQRPVLLSTNVYNNVAFGLKIRGRGKQKDKIEGALDRVGLTHLGSQKARTLSGGEAQRVALARAIVVEPEVLLLDEPTANLDPHNVGLIEQITRQLNKEKGTTIALVTHNVFQAKRLADRVGLFLDGSVIEVAATEKFFDGPKDPRAEAFVKGDIIY